MDNLGTAFSPDLPAPLKLGLSVVFLLLLLRTLRGVDSLPGRFVIVAIWLRFMFSAYHEITFDRIFAGLSPNALLSVATVGVGVLLIDRRRFREVWIVPIYVFMAVALISGVSNRAFSGTVDVIFKWGYAVVLIAATFEALEKMGRERFFRAVLVCFAPPLVLQGFSIALGLPKSGEDDGSASYVGGYSHEAAFSLMIMGFMLVAYLNDRLSYGLRGALIAIGVVSLLFANYRTTLLANVPMLLGFFVIGAAARFVPAQRLLVLMATVPVAVVLGVVAVDTLQQRFMDFAVLFARGDELIKPAEAFTSDEQDIFSGRLFIWNGYLFSYAAGGDMQLLFGFGPNSWIGLFNKYAHNTIVSYLYEFGVMGVAALLLIWGTFLRGTLMLRDALARQQVLLAQIGFFIVNMATMPHWMIEGVVMFGLIQGYLLHQLSEQSRTAVATGAEWRAPSPRFAPRRA